jgi:hypothetical protein
MNIKISKVITEASKPPRRYAIKLPIVPQTLQTTCFMKEINLLSVKITLRNYIRIIFLKVIIAQNMENLNIYNCKFSMNKFMLKSF